MFLSSLFENMETLVPSIKLKSGLTFLPGTGIGGGLGEGLGLGLGIQSVFGINVDCIHVGWLDYPTTYCFVLLKSTILLLRTLTPLDFTLLLFSG